jgi:hypothetical protein
VLGVAAELVECRRIEIAKIGMLAQDRKLAARKRPSFTFIVLRHGSLNSGEELDTPTSVVKAGNIFNRKATFTAI